MICIARTFGAPETVPAGNVARSRSHASTPGAISPATSETRCVTCEKRSTSRNRSTWTLPGRQTRDRSLRPRSTSITCSARSFSEARSRSASPSPAAVVPAIGLRLAREPSSLTCVSGEEPIRAIVVQLEQEEVRRRVDPAQGPVDRERGGRRRPLGALREHDLEGVARADVLLAAPDARLVRRLAGEADERAGRPARARSAGSPRAPRAAPRSPARRRAGPRRRRRRGRSAAAARRRRSG